MNCRIIYKDNKIDHVQAENGERSILFDSLKDIFGAEKALELYALTEEDGYKQKIQEKVRSFVGVTEKQIDKLSEAIEAQETLNKLVETGLADNVYQMTSEEIEAKLVELGVEADVARQVVAYHGSPYSFDRFTTNAMGTGEGAQAFGWGLYFTDLKGIAKNYAEVLSANNSENIAKKLLGRNKVNMTSDFAADFIDSFRANILRDSSKEEFIEAFKNYVFYNENLIREIEEDIENYPLEKDVLLKELNRTKNNLLETNKTLEIVMQITDLEFNTAKKGNGSKNLYKVALHKGKTPSEYTWLEWDTQTAKEVKQKFSEVIKNENLEGEIHNIKLSDKYDVESFDGGKTWKVGDTTKIGTEEEFVATFKDKKEAEKEAYKLNFVESNITGKDLYEALSKQIGQKEASLFLLENGIDGIKYPAESISRGATSDTARGFNYVVFDENAITIEEQIQFQKSGVTPITNGFIYKNDVYLNKNADDSVLLHEFNHLYNNWLKQNRPEVYKKGLDLVKAELKKKNSEIQEIIDFVKTNQPNLEGDALLEEILTEMVGRRGLELLNEQKNKAKSSGIIDYLKQVWQEIKNMLGLSSYTDEQVLNMNLQDFANASAIDLLRGERLKKDEAIKRNNGNPLNLAPNGKPSILYQSYKDLGYSDSEAEKLTAQVYSNSFLDFFGDYLTKSRYNVVTDFRFSTTNDYDFIDGFLGKDDDIFIEGELYRVVEETEESGIYKVDNLKGSVKYVDSFKGKNPSFFTGQLDKNGQPILMHHNTDNNFYEYDLNYKGKNNSSGGSVGKGIYLSKSKTGADKYGGSITKSFFVKANNPYSGVDTFSESFIDLAINLVNQEIDKSNHPDKNYAKEEAKDKIKESLEKGKIPYVSGYLTPLIITEILKNEGFDSIKDGSNDFVVFEPNQIKSATENVGTFSEDSNDIRFSQIIPTFKGNDDIERIKKLNKKGNEDGATFNLDGSTYDKGGLIIPVISLNTTQKELSKELIEKFIQENSSKIGADNIKVGIFKFEDSNEVSIDLNVVVDAKYRDIGLTFGKYAGQESLFDLSTFLPAKTGADGKNPKNFTDEEFRDIANSLSEGKLPSFLNLSPQTSTNYANLTEDGEGNFVFYHVGAKGYDVIKRGTGQNIATSREEATAINRVGGVAMYYPAENVQESMFSGEAKYLIKVPQEKVYDFNRDALNLLDEAEQMFRKQFPNQAFDKNSKLAFVTKVANEKGFDAVVANWDSTTRVQTTKELKPLDEQITEGNKIVKDFSAENKFKSNKDKGWEVVPTVMQSKLLKDVYDKIETLVGNNFSNPLYRVREMAGYTFEDRFAPFKSQDEITDVVEKSNLPQEVKDEYTQAVTSQDKPVYSKLTKKPSLKIEVKEVNGRLVVEPLVNGTKAGALRMLPYEDGYRVDSVAVYDKYQNKRLGTRLYQEAIKFLLKSQTPLYSLKVRSENAKKIWDKFVAIGVAEKVGEDYIAPNKGGLDKNNEAAPSDVMQYANTTDEKLSKEETAEAIDLAVSLGVESSQEAVAILKDAFLENDAFVFNKKKMKKAGFNDYEITKILTDVNLQNQIKNNLAKLENTDFSSPLMDVQTSPEIGIFGKQKVKPKVKTVNVKTVNEQGEVVDKVSDTKELLRKTYPDTLPNDMPQIASSLLKASENVVNNYNDLFYNTLNDLKNAALDLGVDLKDIENRVFPLENFKSFVNSLMEYYANPNDAFAEVYDEFFENYGVEKATKPTMSTPYTEYELFDKFNLVRNGDEYVKVEDVEIEPSAERQAKIPQLEVEDFAVDFDKLEKLVYHKEQLGAEMKTLQKPLVEEINLREVKKNPYLKATSEGVKLVSEDPLTAQKAELYGYEPKVAEKQPKKIETDYSLVQDVLVTQLTSKNKVRTPKGNFTKFIDDNNKSVFLLDGSKQSTVDLEGHLSKADSAPKIEAKKLYSKEEFENNFGCLN